MGKYGKQKSPEEIKVDEYSQRRNAASKPCATKSYWEKGRPTTKPIAGGKENDLRQIKRQKGKNTRAVVYKPISKEGE